MDADLAERVPTDSRPRTDNVVHADRTVQLIDAPETLVNAYSAAKII